MSAAVPSARMLPAIALNDESVWFEARPGIEIKVLAADVAERTAEYLARMPAGYHTGFYHHRADTFVYILTGQLCVAATSALYSAGDCCCQPAGVLHDLVVGPDGVTVYVNQRADGDCLIEFTDTRGTVCDTFRVTEFARHAPIHRVEEITA